MAVAGATPRLHRTRAPPFPAPSPDPFPPPRATGPSQLPAETQVGDPADPFSGSGSLPRALPLRAARGARAPRPGVAVRGGRRRAPACCQLRSGAQLPRAPGAPASRVRPRLGSSLPGPCSAPTELLMVPLHSTAHKAPPLSRGRTAGTRVYGEEEGGLKEPALGSGHPLGGKWLSAKTRDSGREPAGWLLGGLSRCTGCGVRGPGRARRVLVAGPGDSPASTAVSLNPISLK